MSNSKSNGKAKPAVVQEKLPAEIPPEIAQVVKGLPEQKKLEIVQLFYRVQHHSGPLPDAETIKTYNEVIPNGGDRLMKTVENQQEHRHKLEIEGLKRSFNQSSTGQWMGYTLAILFLVASFILALQGKEVTARILGGATLVSLVSVFVVGKWLQKK